MEIVSSVTGSVTGKIIDKPFNEAGRHFGYLYHYNDYIEALRKQAGKLADVRDRVQGKIDSAKRNCEIIENDVQKWITDVENISEEVEIFLEDEVNANKRCLGGWCINVRSCYRLGKEAHKKALAISHLREEGKFEDVSHRAAPMGIITSSSKGIFESRKSIVKQLLEALNNENVSVIGLCGMGGVGKTTLAKEIGKQVQESKRYDTVVMAVVSHNLSIVKIQGEIAAVLGLTICGIEESARAGYLWERIKMEKRILVILDDVWERIDLQKVGIPFGEDHEGCNILLTSRSQGVCNQMDAQKIFIVRTLLEEESWILFREAAGTVVEKSDLNSIARKVAAKCSGLPIAILTVGRALKNRNNKYVWIDAAQQLKKSTPTNIEGMHKDVISSLELSYNYLESEEAKKLFLFCCLFPEDYNIKIEVLVRYGMGLRWFKDVDTLEEARVRTHAIVSTLISSFLLIAEDEGYVTMHDVVRDVALVISSKHNNAFMVKARNGLLEWPIRDTFEDLTGISLMSNYIHEVPAMLECPKLQVLLLQENSPLVIPDKFFQGMKDLKDCYLGDLSVIGELSNLEILSLCRSSIKEIPETFCRLSHLWLLDLDHCRQLALIPHGVISQLDKLEEFYMWNTFKNWDCETNAKVVELQALTRLTNLMFHFPQNSILPSHMPFQHLPNFTIAVRVSWEASDFILSTSSVNKYSTRMILSHDMRFSPLLGWVKDLLKRSEFLFLHEFIGVQDIDGDLISGGFTELKCLTLQSCDNVKYLLNTLERAAPHETFHNLEELTIYSNHSFVEICHGQVLPAGSFNKLKRLDVKWCQNILNIAPIHLLRRLKNLEYCSVFFCASLLHVFDLQGLDIVNQETKFLASLKEIELIALPEMTHIWKGDSRLISLCSLKKLCLWACDNLTKLFSHNSLLQSLASLEDVTIISSSIAESLVLLKTLRVISCAAVQEIVTDRERSKGASAERIEFPSLFEMELRNLDSLTCFCSGQFLIEFPALEMLTIAECPKIKTFGYGDQVTAKLNRVELQEGNRWTGNLNDTVKQLFHEQVCS
ncbi:hypothetical protein CICLE_v10003660mg [Citrus x clementina]|uniref:Uncharacterized protein n=1 Tax=Citrus clementina TaxID=85681 RepID=V4T0K7_CITCL|nr:hypothetical protein CICLE_v10003660mg [Citrus x clementina]